MSASLVTYAAIQALKPDLIINAGTAGGFKVCFLCQDYFDCFVFFFLVSRSEIILGQSTFIYLFAKSDCLATPKVHFCVHCLKVGCDTSYY